MGSVCVGCAIDTSILYTVRNRKECFLRMCTFEAQRHKEPYDNCQSESSQRQGVAKVAIVLLFTLHRNGRESAIEE